MTEKRVRIIPEGQEDTPFGTHGKHRESMAAEGADAKQAEWGSHMQRTPASEPIRSAV